MKLLRIPSLRVKVEENKLDKKICQYLKINPKELIHCKIVRCSLDARNKSQLYFVYVIDVSLRNEEVVLKRVKKAPKETYQLPNYGEKLLNHRPVIIGFGPSGMFAGLLLSQMGFRPIIFERGDEVSRRKEAVKHFWENGQLNVESNIQFGEGGAGTFSDGKLTTRIKDIRIQYILKTFVDHGAKSNILTDYNPHIGTDYLVDVVKNIRETIIDNGGEIHFNAKLQDIIADNDKIKKIKINDKVVEVDDVILAIGNSSRDTFKMLYEKGVEIKQKPFAVGFRIEHPQIMINKAQYGKKYWNYPKLGAAEYKLTYHATNGKSVYTFCMCPGGVVVPSTNEYNTVVVNGMSEYKRDKENANSALVCTVNHKDFKSDHPLGGMYFQQDLERKAFILGGSNYDAPVQLVRDFIDNVPTTKLGRVKPSYTIGYKLCHLNTLFDEKITKALKEGIIAMGQKLRGFSYDEAILTGVETRTSSPIRILRDKETLESANIKGIYPSGEGAGYSGGITSSAIDGLKVAEKIINKYKL